MLQMDKLLWLASCVCVTVSWPTRLMGGEETTIDEYPYMAGLEKWNSFECGSTIIHKTWALTAGHCVRGDENPKEIWLRVGSTNRRSGGWMVAVFRAMKHENTKANDIALLFMAREFPLGEKVKIVTIPEQGAEVADGAFGKILGWGDQAPNTDSVPALKKVYVTVLPREACQPEALVPINDADLCARPETTGLDACRGDSGGPLLLGHFQVGIIRRGHCTSGPNNYILFTNVAHFRQSMDNVMDWPPVVPP